MSYAILKQISWLGSVILLCAVSCSASGHLSDQTQHVIDAANEWMESQQKPKLPKELINLTRTFNPPRFDPMFRVGNTVYWTKMKKCTDSYGDPNYMKGRVTYPGWGFDMITYRIFGFAVKGRRYDYDRECWTYTITPLGDKMLKKVAENPEHLQNIARVGDQNQKDLNDIPEAELMADHARHNELLTKGDTVFCNGCLWIVSSIKNESGWSNNLDQEGRMYHLTPRSGDGESITLTDEQLFDFGHRRELSKPKPKFKVGQTVATPSGEAVVREMHFDITRPEWVYLYYHYEQDLKEVL